MMLRMFTRSVSVVVLVLFCGTTSDAKAWQNVDIGNAIPSMTLLSLGGKPVQIAAHTSRVLCVLYVKAGHKRSEKALVELKKLRAKYSAKELRIIVVANVRHHGRAGVRRLMKGLKLPFTVLTDDKERFWAEAGLYIFPSTGIIDGKGMLRYEYGGFRADYVIALRRQIDAVLGRGPSPDSIKENDRHEVPPEIRREQRLERMKRKMQVREAMRYRGRLLAARQLLAAQGVNTILGIYDKWIAAKPLPLEPVMRQVAKPPAEGEVDSGILKKRAAEAGPRQGQYLFWLGRLQAQRKEWAAAEASFRKCLALDTGLDVCGFELAKILSPKDKVAAVASCRRAFSLMVGETPTTRPAVRGQ